MPTFTPLVSPLDLAAQALSRAAGCPPPAALVTAFQTAYVAANPSWSYTAGVYDDATVAAIYAALGVVAGCPSANVVALAQAVVADTTVCSGAVNANVTAFMNAYNAWQFPNPSFHLAVSGIYGADVQSAINTVLGAGSAPTCATAPASSGTATTASSATPAAPAASNTGLYVGAGVAVVAIAALAYAMSTKSAATVAGAAMKNPISPEDRVYKRELLWQIQAAAKTGAILRLQGRTDDAARFDRVVDNLAEHGEKKGWSDAVLLAEQRGQQAGMRTYNRAKRAR